MISRCTSGPPYICQARQRRGLLGASTFEGNEKVFICHDREELLEALDQVYASGYPDHDGHPGVYPRG